MKNLFQVGIVLFLGSISYVSFGQQDPHFTQYFDNTLFVNPAYAGSNGVLNATALHRQQWVGFDGRPVSTTFSLHSPLSYKSVGLGITAVNDVIGPMNQTMFYGDFSYTLKFKDARKKLAFGLKAGMNLVNVGTSGLIATDDGDANVITNTTNRVLPNIGAGIYYHTPRFFIGGSIPKFLEKSYDGINDRNTEKRHYFAIMGGVFKLNQNWKMRPTTQLKITPNAPLSLDVSAAGIFMDKLWLGLNYRLDAALGAFVQYQISPQFKAGLATDFGTQDIRKANDGTFEVMLSYDFVFEKLGVRSPRYF